MAAPKDAKLGFELLNGSQRTSKEDRRCSQPLNPHILNVFVEMTSLAAK
jgi:hypothetical protein